MNIFILSECPYECARLLDDKRVIKMVLETAQMLSTAARSAGWTVGYKATHANHPCNKWARGTQDNYNWLAQHGLALCEEYTKRYGKVHKSEEVIKMLASFKDILPSAGRTPFANCAANKEFGLDYKHIREVTVAYKMYLADRWELDKRTPTWYGIGR